MNSECTEPGGSSSVSEDLCCDLGFHMIGFEEITLMGGEVLVHGFSLVGLPSPSLGLLVGVLLLESPGSGSFWSKDFLVGGGKVGPLVVMAIWVKGVAWGMGNSVMVESEGVDPFEDWESSLSKGDSVWGIGVRARGVRLIGESSGYEDSCNVSGNGSYESYCSHHPRAG